MVKWKATLIDVLICCLLIGLLYLCWNYSIRAFWMFALIFAAYGFIQFAWTMYGWLQEPGKEQTRSHVKRKDPPFKVDPIPDAWINPFKDQPLADIQEEINESES